MISETATIQNSIIVAETVTVDGVTAEHILRSLGQMGSPVSDKVINNKTDNHKVRMLERAYPIQNR